MIGIVIYTALFLYGVFIGNFATSLFYRLPRNITLFGFDTKSTKPPFCSTCSHELKFYEYLPILSWFSTLGKCNYCHTPITKKYIALEVLTGLMAIILYYLLGTNLELFFIYFAYVILVLLNIFIYLEHGFGSLKITLAMIILGMIYRTLLDHEIFGWLLPFSLASILCIWIVSRNFKEAILLVHLIMPASLWISNYSLMCFAIILTIAYFLQKFAKLQKLFFPFCLASLYISSLASAYILA